MATVNLDEKTAIQVLMELSRIMFALTGRR